jgi:hypothetical protein
MSQMATLTLAEGFLKIEPAGVNNCQLLTGLHAYTEV